MKLLPHGFTLIELMVAITVAGILAGIAVPAFRSFLQNDRDTGQINSLVGSFSYARSEAVKRASGNGVAVCPSPDGLNCALTPWSGGWIVKYTDPVIPANTVVLQAVPALTGGNSVTLVGASPAAGVTFLSSGLTSLPPGGVFTLRICDSRGAAFARQIEVLSTGRVAASQKPGFAVDQVTPLTCP